MEWGSMIFHFFAGTSKFEFPICWLVVYGFSSLLPSSFPSTIQANFAKHLPEHLRLHKKAAKQKASSTTNSLRKATKSSATSSNPTVSPTFSQLKRCPVPASCCRAASGKVDATWAAKSWRKGCCRGSSSATAA